MYVLDHVPILSIALQSSPSSPPKEGILLFVASEVLAYV